MPAPKGTLSVMDPESGPLPAPGGASSLLFLREEEIRLAQDLLFFGYRDFTGAADRLLDELGLGRAHHRALHFIGRNPGMPVSDLLGLLRITKQSLARVLSLLVERGYVAAGARAGGPAAAAAHPDGDRPGAGAAAVRAPARAAGGGVPRGRRPRRRGLPAGDARHHGRGGAPLRGQPQRRACGPAAAPRASGAGEPHGRGARRGACPRGGRRCAAARAALALPRRARVPGDARPRTPPMRGASSASCSPTSSCST